MPEATMKYVLEAEDRTKAALQSAQGGFARLAGAFAAGTVGADYAKRALNFLGNELMSCVQKSMEAQSNMALYTQSLSVASGASKEQIQMLYEQAENIEKVGGVSKEAVMQIQSTTSEYNLQADSIAKLTPAIVDYAAKQKGSNLTAEEAKNIANGFGKAMQGQNDILTKSGFIYTSSQKHLMDYGTEVEKVNTLTDILNQTYKGANETLGNTAEGKIRKLTTAYDDFKKSVGDVILQGLGPLIDDSVTTSQTVAEATKKTDGWSQALFSFGQGGMAAADILFGLGLAVGSTIDVIISFISVIVAGAKDAVNNFGNIRKAGVDLFEALAKFSQKDFIGAFESIKKVPREFDFSSTISAFSDWKDSAGYYAGVVADKFGEAWGHIVNGATGTFKRLDELSGGGGGPPPGGGAKKLKEAYTDALKKISDAAQDTQGKMSDLIYSYGQKTADQLKSHIDKISELNSKLISTQADFNLSQSNNDRQYADDRLSLFMGHQDKQNDLMKQSQDLRTQMSSEEDVMKRNQLMQQVAEIQKQLTTEQAIVDQNSSLATAAAKYRQTSDLDRLKQKYDDQKAADVQAFNDKMASIKLEVDTENKAYADQTMSLKMETTRRFDEIMAEYQKGYAKIIKESKVKGKMLAGLQAAAKADLDKLVATATTSLGIVSGVQSKAGTKAPGAAGGNTFNFTFNGEVADRDTLIRTLVDAVNRATAVQAAAKAW